MHALLLASALAASELPAVVIDVEAGPTAILQNDGRYGPGGTAFDAEDVGQTRNLLVTTRLSAEVVPAERHRLILLWAPFGVTTVVALDRDLRFEGTDFGRGQIVQHRYRFDGYRGSYLYSAVRSDRFRLELGGSLQIRNAAVEFLALPGDAYAINTDVGLVPALKARATWEFSPGWTAMLDADGLSTFGLAGDTTGGLYDVSLSLGAEVDDGALAFVRLRLYGGGADIPDSLIDNWATFFSASAGVRADLEELF